MNNYKQSNINQYSNKIQPLWSIYRSCIETSQDKWQHQSFLASVTLLVVTHRAMKSAGERVRVDARAVCHRRLKIFTQLWPWSLPNKLFMIMKLSSAGKKWQYIRGPQRSIYIWFFQSGLLFQIVALSVQSFCSLNLTKPVKGFVV